MDCWARRPGTYAGQTVDFGQVFRLPSGSRNEQLLRLGYVERHKGKATASCGHCGAKFRTSHDATAHGDKRHGPSRPSAVRNLDEVDHDTLRRMRATDERYYPGDQLMAMDPDDADLERETKLLEERAPLYLENTVASRK